MQTISLNSTLSKIRNIWYDNEERLLKVESVTGEIFQYFDVHDFMYHKFIDVPLEQKDDFLNTEIRFTHRYQKEK